MSAASATAQVIPKVRHIISQNDDWEEFTNNNEHMRQGTHTKEADASAGTTYVHATSVKNAEGILNTIERNVKGDITVKLATTKNASIGDGKKLAFLGVPSKIVDPLALQYFGNQYGTVVFHFKHPVDGFEHSGWAMDSNGLDRRWSGENSVVALLTRGGASVDFGEEIKHINYGKRALDMDAIYTLQGLDTKKDHVSGNLHLHPEAALESEDPIEMVLSHIEVVPHWFQRDHPKWRCVRTFTLATYKKAEEPKGEEPTPCTDCIYQGREKGFSVPDQIRRANEMIAGILKMKDLDRDVRCVTRTMQCMNKKCTNPTDSMCNTCMYPCCPTCEYCPKQCQGTTKAGNQCKRRSDFAIREALSIEETGYCTDHQPKVDGRQLPPEHIPPQIKMRPVYARVYARGTIKCSGLTETRCKMRTLEAGKSYCRHHSSQNKGEPFREDTKEKFTCMGYITCKVKSDSGHEDATPLKQGKRYCALHTDQNTKH